MYNLLISIAAGVVVTLAIRFGTNIGWVGSVGPGAVAIVVAYFVLARRSMKKLELVFMATQKELQGQRFEKAIQLLKDAFALAPWQFLVAEQLNAQIGTLLYIKRDFDDALPYLEKSFSRHWVARAMLAAVKWKKKDAAGAYKVFEETVKTSKKEPLPWAVYAWCLEKDGRHDEAVKVLARAVEANPSDEKLKSALVALQNGKKLKLGKLYEEQWFQFHLEQPPPQYAGGPGMRGGGRRVVYQRR